MRARRHLLCAQKKSKRKGGSSALPAVTQRAIESTRPALASFEAAGRESDDDELLDSEVDPNDMLVLASNKAPSLTSSEDNEGVLNNIDTRACLFSVQANMFG